jgi:hypothetical protein
VLTGGVDQDQVAVPRNRVSCGIVQHAGIGARSDDRAIRRPLRAVFAECVQQLCFEFVLAHAGVRRGHGAAMREGRDLTGAAHDGQFVGVLEETHLVEDR